MEPSAIYLTLLEVSILVTAAEALNLTLSRYGYPRLMGELLVGLALSPYALGGLLNSILHLSLFSLSDYIVFLSEFSVILLLFASGLEHGLSSLKQGGIYGFLAAFFGAIVPYATVYETLRLMGISPTQASVIAISMAPTSLAVVAGLIEEEGAYGLPGVKVLITAASIDDIVALILLSSMLPSSGISGKFMVIWQFAKFMALWAIFLALSIAIVPRLINRLEGAMVTYASLLALFGLVAAMTTAGFSAVIAAFVAGVAVAESVKSAVVRRGVDELLAIFGPVFFLTMGLQVDPRALIDSRVATQYLTVYAVATLSKIAGVLPFAYIRLRDLKQSTMTAVGMVPRGEMGLVVASIGYSSGLIGQDGLAAVVSSVLLTTVTGAIAFKKTIAKPEGNIK